jgi:membrane protein implicated in regulation of membrane protease activity
MDLNLFGYQIPDWQIYVALGVLIMSAEIFTAGFVLLPIGIAVVMTGVFSLFVTSLAWQMVFLSINLTVMFFFFRRYIAPQFTADHLKTNMDSMIGKEATVLETISADGSQGYVKLYGDEWRALPLTATTIEKGTKVTIEKLDGNKVYVKPKTS